MAIADKFYTKPEIANKCFILLKNFLNLAGEETFLEPTAGSGVFLNFLKNYEAYDIIPEDNRIVQKDIFEFDSKKKDFITIGNPPFGKRSKLAIKIFNKIANYSEAIGFILPVSFMKYGTQKELNKNFKLVNFYFLPPFSFMDREKEYDVNCVFQIWVKSNSKYDNFKNLRILKSPPISNPDFKIWQYNATPKAFECVNENWKYAVFRQGYKDYKKIFTIDDKQEVINMMKKNIQFFFFSPCNETAETIFRQMDFNQLAARNTSTPGFGKGDFVSYYNEIKSLIT